MLSRLALPTFILSSLLVALADPVPTGPSPNQTFNEGSTCTISWTADTTGVWKKLDIELMTGDNINMQFLTTVASGIDGTVSPGAFSYPCPNVTPNSAIYFYQFSTIASPNHSWTGRFAIADSTGATVPPANSNQPDGEAIPWGIGMLTDPSTAVPAPSYLSVNSNSTGPTTSTNTTSMISSVTTSTSSTGLSTTNPTLSTPSSSSSSSASTPGTSSSNSNSAGDLAVGVASMHAGAALAVVAATFTFLF
ncbi:hypothetical protein EI94DRAFT_1570624 [Lactarius quietus]|nr:hypothetical protein EI94DRAFT_1570624 [Lactarius quietus]